MSAPARIVVTLATATPGGGFPVFGQAFAEAIHATDATLEIQQRNTKGSTENVLLLERGEVDLGLVQGEVAYEAIGGIGRAPADLRILTAMYSTRGCSWSAAILRLARSPISAAGPSPSARAARAW